MNKNSGALLKDIRNIKRNYTMTQKQMITSAKQLKKARSSQQLSFNQFLETKNEKIKNIDERLQIHQSEIQKNNNIIQQLNHNFIMMKDQMLKEKQKWQNEERRNKLLRQEIQRTNKILRNRNQKIEQFSKKAELLERQNQILKTMTNKIQEKEKIMNSQKKQIISLEENLNEKKHNLIERERQLKELREKFVNLDILKQQEEASKEIILGNEKQITEMTNKIKHLEMEKNKFECKSVDLETKTKKLAKLLDEEMSRGNQIQRKFRQLEVLYNENHQKLVSMENEQIMISNRLKSKENMEQQLKSQIKQHRVKAQNLNFQLDNTKIQLIKRDEEITKFSKKIKQLESHHHNSIKDLEDRKNSEHKLESLRKKAKGLQEMYKTMIPQIQCPYGHELHNPVTIIPCGHNYCLSCKKGYAKQCMQCTGKLKIEAVYRNELMDDIIGIINSIRQIIEALK